MFLHPDRPPNHPRWQKRPHHRDRPNVQHEQNRPHAWPTGQMSCRRPNTRRSIPVPFTRHHNSSHTRRNIHAGRGVFTSASLRNRTLGEALPSSQPSASPKSHSNGTRRVAEPSEHPQNHSQHAGRSVPPSRLSARLQQEQNRPLAREPSDMFTHYHDHPQAIPTSAQPILHAWPAEQKSCRTVCTSEEPSRSSTRLESHPNMIINVSTPSRPSEYPGDHSQHAGRSVPSSRSSAHAKNHSHAGRTRRADRT